MSAARLAAELRRPAYVRRATQTSRPDGERVFVATEKGVELIRLRGSGAPPRPACQRRVEVLELAVIGRSVLLVGESHRLVLYDLERRHLSEVRTAAKIERIAVSPYGHRVGVVTEDESLRWIRVRR